MPHQFRIALLALTTLLLLATSCRQDSPQPEAPSPAAPTAPAKDPLAAWKPSFDPSGAEFTYLLSNVDHPTIAGIAVGYQIRDRVWERSGGRLYVDFRPLAQLGGEKDVLNKLKLGAVQGMLCSSVAAVNVADRLGIVNLPFVVDSADKLERFRQTPDLWEPYRDAALAQGILVADFTGYGGYGWATAKPVQTLEEARQVNFRVAQAPVNTDTYKAWGLKFTVIPWPDVPQALQTGVINGLDHTPIVCSITRKFDVTKAFTRLDYAQGLYIHMINKAWLDGLPSDLKNLLLETISEESARARALTRRQEEEQIAQARTKGIVFLALAQADRQELQRLAAPVYAKWGERIGSEYLERVRKTLNP